MGFLLYEGMGYGLEAEDREARDPKGAQPILRCVQKPRNGGSAGLLPILPLSHTQHFTHHASRG